MKKNCLPVFWLSLVLSLVVGLAACGPIPGDTVIRRSATKTPDPNAANTPKPVIQTSIGDLLYVSARYVDEVHGVRAGENSRILLVILERADGEEIDVEAFRQAAMNVKIEGDDGSSTGSSMGGWVDDEFAMGFMVPKTAQTLELAWPDNSPIPVTP